MKPEPIFAIFHNIDWISKIHLFCKQLHQINTFSVQNFSLQSKMAISSRISPFSSQKRHFAVDSETKFNFCPVLGQNDHFQAKITNLRPKPMHFRLKVNHFKSKLTIFAQKFLLNVTFFNFERIPISLKFGNVIIVLFWNSINRGCIRWLE